MLMTLSHRDAFSSNHPINSITHDQSRSRKLMVIPREIPNHVDVATTTDELAKRSEQTASADSVQWLLRITELRRSAKSTGIEVRAIDNLNQKAEPLGSILPKTSDGLPRMSAKADRNLRPVRRDRS